MGAGELLSLVREAESQRFDFVGLGDSQLAFREVYASLGALARETDTLDIGPNVTNPVTRHPVVLASATCTVDELSGGRAVFGVGTGDSAVATLGKRPARLSAVEETVELFRSLSRGGRHEYEGTDLTINWIGEDEPREIPVMMAGSGPKSLKLAGRLADRVLVGNGFQPTELEWVTERIEAGAREAGRAPADVDVWVYARANIGESRAAAVNQIKSVLASAANQGLAFTTERQNVPEHLVDAIEELQDRYDPEFHVGTGEDNPNALLMDELGLTEYLADRFAIAGTSEDCVDQIERVQRTDLVDGILFSNVTEQTEEFVKRMGEEVFPRIRR